MADYADIIQQMGSAAAPQPVAPLPASQPAAGAPAPASAPANPYIDIVRQMDADTQRTANDNLLAAQPSKPDAAARAMQLAPQVGVPAPAVEADLPGYEQQAQLQQNRQIMQSNPVLAQWVAANPPAARIAQDDFQNLDTVSKLMTAWKSGAVSALAQNQLGRLYNDKQVAGLTGSTTPDTDAQIKGTESTLAAQPQLHGFFGGVQSFSGFAAGVLDNILSGAPEAAAGAALGAAASPEVAGAGAIPGAIAGGFMGMKVDMARVSAGLTYRAMANVHDAAGNQLSEPAKQLGALVAGALTYGIAGIGGGAAAKVGGEAISPFVSDAVTEAMSRPTVAAALRTGALAAAKGGVQGAALNAAMDGAQLVGEELAKQISPGDFQTVFNDPATRAQAVTRLADAAESGALLFGGLHGVGAGVHFAGDMLKVRQAQADMDMFQQLQDGAASSATRARSPQAFASFLQSQADGAPVDNLFVPAERIMQLYQSKGIDPSTGTDPLFGWMPDMAKQLGEALPLGGDVVIPTSDYVAHMAGTDVSRELLPDIRVRQDGMSMNDVRTFAQSARDGLAQDAQQFAATDDPVRQIFDDVVKQTRDAGYTDDAAQQYGSLFAARYAARAQRLGVDPMDLYRQSGVEVKAADQPSDLGAQQLAQDHENARGAITMGNGKSLIELFRGRDLSTLLHEGGHLWLEELRADAERPDAPEGLKSDFDTVRNWMGLGDGEEIGVDQHEQFARAAEAYFMEGKAPSGALASAFSKFKSWLGSIYKSIKSLNTPVNDDIRGVFDRLVATDEEIENARRAQHLRATFSDAASAGMTEREFAEYQKTVDASGAAADSTLLPKVMEHVRKKRQSDYDAYRAKVKADVTREVDATPDIAALETLRTGQLGDGAEGIKIGKLSAKEVDAAYGAGTSERMPKGTVVKRAGIHPDDMADVLGFRSGDELVRALVSLEQQERDIRQTPGERRTARQYIIDRRTDFRMSEERPDILSDGSIHDEAVQAIHNQEAQRALQIELRSLGRRIHQEAFSLDDVRQWAKEQIAGKTVRDVQLTGKYSRAEAVAARRVEQALVDGDHAGAYVAKRQQVLNHHLYVAAKQAAEEIQSGAKEMNRYANKRTIKGMAQDYLDQIHALLDRFDFGDASQREVARRKSLREWADKQRANGEDLYVPTELLNEAYQKHYSELTVDEFRGLRDTVEQIAHLGKTKQTLLDGADERDFDSVVAEAVAQADKLKDLAVPLERNPGSAGNGALDRINAKWLNMKSSLRSADSSLLKMEQVFDWLDGHDSNGVFNRVVFRRLADAGVRENDLRGNVVRELRALHDNIPVEATKDWGNRYELPELVDSRTGQPTRMLKKDIIAMALNVGNESNFSKLMSGEGWTRHAIWTVLNRHMSKADWDFVQGSWDLIETLWPEVEAMEKRLSGVAPDKVRATEVSTPHGRYRGGYYPAIYDPTRAYDVELNRQRSGDKLFENNYTRATTEKGHTIERIQDYSRPLYLNLDVLPRHLTGVIHDIAYREAIMDADRFLSDERVREAVETHLGREIYKQFRPWLQSIANERNYDARGMAFWDQVAHGLRTRATMVGLGYRATTMLIHGGSALANSIGEIGSRWMLSGIHAFDTPAKWATTRDFVFDRSGEMRNRMNEVDRDVRDALREMEQYGNRNPIQKAYDGARRFAFYGVAMLDMGSAMPTWVGAYNKGLHEGLSEQDAVYAADKAVRNAHGGNGAKDLAAVQRGTEVQKLFTMFYSFWNHFYNRQRDIVRRAGDAIDSAREGDYRGAARDFSMVAARSFFYFVVPQLIHAALKPSSGTSNDDGHSWLSWAAEEIGLGLFSGIPGVRDVATAATTGRDYEATPVAQMINGVLHSGKDISGALGITDNDPSGKWVKHATQNAGYVFGLPTGQASGSMQFLWDVMHGDQDPKDVSDWLHGLVYGKVKE